MTVAAAVAAPWHRAHIYKALACIVFVLIALQYLLSGAIDRRSIETIFTINTSRPPHQRALVIYGPASASSNNNVINNNNNNNNNEDEDDSSSGAGPPPGNSSLVSTSSAVIAPTNNSSILLNSMLRTNSSGSPLDVEAVIRLRNATSSTVGLSTSTSPTATQTPRCPLVPPNLVGPIAVSKSPPDLAAMEKAFAKVKQGGRGAPEDCVARYRVAIVIPFRDRFPHLMTLLYNLHPLLLRQQLDYQIFVIEQEGNGQFNRAMLMNIGYVEALKERPFDCFIFHDVDLLPENDRNLYTCPEQPRHMSVAVDKFLYRLPYSDLFGGVSAMTTEHFRLVNGFSNVFWGWGAEDDDMANRIKARGLHISRYPANIARYKMLTHKKEKANPKRYEFLKTGKKRFLTDGLSNLQYEILVKKKPKLYTWFLARLTPPAQPS
ncbi:beta-1,4-N-acetylgalactosaminyltransferase bre-4 [Nasonia vitripennis]|uniref:Beta-1,4-N-acetylgalactosaminyltransferase n=1 Tax=Nasonia vitripennis TaxID=7425 RepID=A0A7M7Q1L8_NASVI|nr:beta-1,4-N-acetylgalactosaminyltransferase bre-4 [Nasonia vitripennis]XP_031779210.1 beta-1,4-N-acetylgalactosaminyltransferase bre-4 [Nasonia vitripennis]